MPENGNQGNGSTGQESGAGNQGTGQESGQQSQQGNGQQTNGTGQESGEGQQGGQGQGGTNTPPDFSTMPESELRTYAARLHQQAGEARQEAAGYRTRATAAEGKVTEAERAAMTEQERVQSDLQQTQGQVQTLTEENTGLKAQVEDLTRGAAVREALAGAGAINAATAFRVGSWDDVKLKEDGSLDLDSFKAAAQKLRTSDPYLFRRGADAGAGAGRDSSPEGGDAHGINAALRGIGNGRSR